MEENVDIESFPDLDDRRTRHLKPESSRVVSVPCAPDHGQEDECAELFLHLSVHPFAASF